MQKKTLHVMGITLLLGLTLTGCQAELPQVEQDSLKLIAGIKDKVKGPVSPEQPPTGQKVLPPGSAQTGERTIPKEQKETVVVVGGLIHPTNSKNPQIVTPDGRYYELVANRTSYDIYTVRKEIAYLMVKVVINGSKDGSVQYAELQEVVTEGKPVYARLDKNNGKYKLKWEDEYDDDDDKGKGKGKGKGHAYGRKKNDAKEFVIIENRTGLNLDQFVGKGKERVFFIQIVGKVEGDVRVIVHGVY